MSLRESDLRECFVLCSPVVQYKCRKKREGAQRWERYFGDSHGREKLDSFRAAKVNLATFFSEFRLDSGHF